MWNIKNKQQQKKTDEQTKPKQTCRYREQSCSYQRGRGEGEMGKGGQLYGDGWKLTFGSKHAVVYIEVEICYAHKTYVVINQCSLNKK